MTVATNGPPAVRNEEKAQGSFTGSTTSLHSISSGSNSDIEKVQTLSEQNAATESNVDHDPYLVRFEQGDSNDPRQWSGQYRAFCTFQLSMLTFVTSMGSSILSPAIPIISAETHISQGMGIFTVSLYVLGYAFGPLFWAGISETFGRRMSILPPMFGLAFFSIGTGFSHTAAAVFVTRFFGGLFGSAPVSNVSACLGDMYPPKTRAIAVSFYSLAIVGGPVLGPVVGSALTVKLDWHWTGFIEAISAFTVAVFAFFFLPETYAPVLLKRKAIRLRKVTKINAWYHPHENVKLSPKAVLTRQVTRPIRMLIEDPIVLAVALYASFVYALLYMTLRIVPLVFGQIRGWAPISSTLPFLAIFAGVLCALLINLGNVPFYNRAVDAKGGRAVPEARLPPMIIGAICFSTGLFWFGWTASPQYSWILPAFAAAFIGAGFNVIFQQCINYLVDSYALYAASAVSANTFLRSLLAAGLPFAVSPMFLRLGPGVAMTILGSIAAMAIPLPLLFMRYGVRLRRLSKYAAKFDDES